MRDSLRTTLNLDLARGDERAAANIDVVSTAASHICTSKTSTVDAKVQCETSLFKATEEILLGVRHAPGEMLAQSKLNREWKAFMQQVGFFGRGSARVRGVQVQDRDKTYP